ncbi:hypothetical protein [Streptomyces iakyrus]|uniref:hypothetical protein n=1 Tax=Streptomyces iakyrus TaxID=68219 RepID=UPI003D8B7186
MGVVATAKSGSESGFGSALTDAEVTVDYPQDVTAQVQAIAPDGVAELTAVTRDGGAFASALTVPEASEDRKLHTAMLQPNPTPPPCPPSPGRSPPAPSRCR